MQDGTPKTEMVYVHSKVMIVDDMAAICGSANINDRSMLGNRDGELAVLIEDKKTVPGKLRGVPCNFGYCVHEWRKRIFAESFGMSMEEVMDPLDHKMWDEIDYRTSRNVEIYREVFGCYPDNEMKTLDDIKRIEEKAVTKKYYEVRESIKGVAVTWPSSFLENENYNKIQSFDLVLSVIPSYCWT